MAMYGYVSGYYKDKIIREPDFERRVNVLLGSGIPIKKLFC